MQPLQRSNGIRYLWPLNKLNWALNVQNAQQKHIVVTLLGPNLVLPIGLWANVQFLRQVAP